MIELNLLPDVKQEFIRTQAQKKLVISLMIIVSMGAAAVVLLLIFYVYVAQPGLRQLVNNDIENKITEINKKKGQLTTNLTIQNQLASVTKLHEDKGAYDRFFDYFRSLNPEVPNNISISQATVDTTTTTIHLDASAKNFQAVAVFQDTLRNAELKYYDPVDEKDQKVPLFSEVTISEAGLGQDSKGTPIVSFKVALIYDSSAFSWTVRNPAVTVPNKTTTPSAAQVSVFADNPIKKEEGVQ
jgi:hypothetical protein